MNLSPNRFMLEHTYAKINLSLSVLGKDHDNYHRLDSLMGFVDFYDTLHITPAHQSELYVHGTPPTMKPEENLSMRALRALQQQGIGEYRMTLNKHIYTGAGLGGGSANAAGVLRALGGELPKDVLHQIARSLGADVVPCFYSRPLRARGVGDKVEFVLDFPLKYLVLIAPKVHLSTQAVFQRGLFSTDNRKASPARHDDPETWHNDLEAAATALCPEIAVILESLRALPKKIVAGMSGSGSCCFVAFAQSEHQQESIQHLTQQFPAARIRAAQLLRRHNHA